ncbi:hypothetical protein BCD_1048 (plasmid) [Borrelia crocidurae DOU]|uniref:Uncharacterized protein n=1 Tax=Borrelia crocidurae DOU TaxID=1293575 RepID=W5SIY3_9SPIR|nr:hypothetical protein BCD_1048 [Borrelia crocidurae DOU]
MEYILIMMKRKMLVKRAIKLSFFICGIVSVI